MLVAASRHPEKARRTDDDQIQLRFYVRSLIASIDLDNTIWLLDELTRDLACTCGARSVYECNCLHAISRFVGALLDRYFTLSTDPHDANRIWSWTNRLRFRGQARAEDSAAVSAMKQDNVLRRGIHRIAFAGLSTPDQVWQRRIDLSMSHSHSGLDLSYADILAMADYAVESGNSGLWSGFYSRHNKYASEPGKRDMLRTKLRVQMRSDSEKMRIWYKNERAIREFDKKDRSLLPRSRRSYERRESAMKEKNQEYFRANRERIVAGNDWRALRWIADQYLINPEKLSELISDADAELALRNCFVFLKPHVPTLASLVENKPYVLRVLHAACLAHFRHAGNLDAIDDEVLAAVKTDIGGYEGYQEDELERLVTIINRRVLATREAVEQFARTFVEPQLTRADDAVTDVDWMSRDEAFAEIAEELAFEWLQRFPDMPSHARETLFDVCAKKSERSELNALIVERCTALAGATDPSNSTKARDFWYLRAFFFLENPPPEVWGRFKVSPDTIFMIESRAGRFGRGDNTHWPELSAEKIFGVLDMYIDAWPKVVLPSSYGTGDPPQESAFRFLSDIVWRIDGDEPSKSIPVFDKLLADPRFSEFADGARSLRASAVRKRALQTFTPPAAGDIVGLLDKRRLATVEDLRALMIEELEAIEQWARNTETNPLRTFYVGKLHVDENTARDRIVDRLQARMAALGLNVNIERYMANMNRCDITVEAVIGGAQRLLVVEVKGQWHKELYTAAAKQLHDRYSSHPHAAQQGIYLVLWFGAGVEIAGKRDDTIANPQALRAFIMAQMPRELHDLVDVVVIDLSPNA